MDTPLKHNRDMLSGYVIETQLGHVTWIDINILIQKRLVDRNQTMCSCYGMAKH